MTAAAPAVLVAAVVGNLNMSPPTSKQQLRDVIREEIRKNGYTCNLNHIDISQVNDFSGLFIGSRFNGDISQWDVSHVDNMVQMFGSSSFNGDISSWDVSNVKNMRDMFEDSQFNGNISNWDVSQVKYFEHMFGSGKFNGDISKWDVARFDQKTGERCFRHLHHIFLKTSFCGDLKPWNISNDHFPTLFGKGEAVSHYFHQRQIIEESTLLHQQFNPSHTNVDKRRKIL